MLSFKGFFQSLSESRKIQLGKYVISFIIFVVYLTFFDQYSLIKQYKLQQSLHALEEEKIDFQNQLAEAIENRKLLEEDAEKFAREKYFMHRADEDIYIIEKE